MRGGRYGCLLSAVAGREGWMEENKREGDGRKEKEEERKAIKQETKT